MEPKEEKPRTFAPTPSVPAGPVLPRARPVLSRRARLIGAALAVLVMLVLAGLAWYLTQPAATAAGTGRPAASGAAVSGAASGAAPGGAGNAAGSPSGPAGRRGAPPITVGVATAERASVPIVLDALGTVTPQATVRVRPQVSGVLEKVLFTEGQMVRAGQLLATIDPRQFEMALQQASGQALRDQAQLESARVTLQRFKTLLDQDSIARQDVDTQAALVKQLEGTVIINKANEGTARLNLSYTRVVAPVSGRVGLRVVDVGNVVNTGDANGIVLITQIAPIDVVFAIAQDQAGELQRSMGSASGKPGASPALKVTALDRTRSVALGTGVFASLDNQVDTQTGTVRAKARFANSNLALFPNQFVNVQLLVDTLDNVVVVPVTAVRRGSAGDYVYVVNGAERTVSLRPVKRGQATVDKVVVSAGLQAGERVITEGADRLKDGASVVLPGDQPRGAGSGGGNRQRPRAAETGASAAADALPADAASRPQRRRPVEAASAAGS
ncbi:MAG: efflux RND transporter periplasmic adaptor subunit [Burkholderiales bacterium]